MDVIGRFQPYFGARLFAMYSPTTRVLTVLELLQSHGRMSGAELARRLEVDGRTLRRYIAKLEDLGIPVVAERGRYGCYSLIAGFKLPPMMFTDDEALALSRTSSLNAVRQRSGPKTASSRSTSSSTSPTAILAAMSPKLRKPSRRACRFHQAIRSPGAGSTSIWNGQKRASRSSCH